MVLLTTACCVAGQTHQTAKALGCRAKRAIWLSESAYLGVQNRHSRNAEKPILHGATVTL